ncbi:hypothetical protein LPJ71_008634, partial [Coemansia sp. S17]
MSIHKQSAILVRFSDVQSYVKLTSRRCSNFLYSLSVRQLTQQETLSGNHVKDALVGNNAIYALDSGQRQGVFLEDLGPAILVVMCHSDYHSRTGGSNQVHCSAHALDDLSRYDPVRQIAKLRDLHTAQD